MTVSFQIPVRIAYVAFMVFAAMPLLAIAPLVHAQGTRTAAAATRPIVVVSEPKATVWINGVRYGRTDDSGKLEINSIPAGAQPLRVRADGFGQKVITLTAARRGQIDVPLQRTTDDAELAFQEAERLAFADREKSAAAYRKATTLNPRFFDAYIGLARVLTEMGDFEEAGAAIAAARKLQPASAEATVVLARIQKEGGEPQKAIESFKRSIREGRGFQPEAYAGLGIYHMDRAEGAAGRGDFEAEAENYTEASKNLRLSLTQLHGAPDSVVIYQLLGLIYERQGKKNEAIATYEEFLRLFPNTIEATAVRSFIVQLKKTEN